METRPPTITRILVAIGFALSCFALALFLWITFGGPLPLKAKGYRFTVPLDEATQLAVESDVRISGVPVGKVKSVELNDQGLADATIELDSDYAPIPTDTRAILRQKTLLGETFVELTPGDSKGSTLKEGGTLPEAQVSPSVQLDEIFRTFNGKTRAAFKVWMQGAAAALRGRGDDLSAAIAELDPFAEETNRVLRILDSQDQAVQQLVHNGGDVFQALSERKDQLRGLIENSNAVFQTTARRNQELADTFRILPTFQRESRETLARLNSFARNTDPLVTQLQPAARELSPTLVAAGKAAPDLKAFFQGLRGAINASPRGMPALRRLLRDDLQPVLSRLGGTVGGQDPWLAHFNPIVEVLGMYRHEITAFLGNAAAATQYGQDDRPAPDAPGCPSPEPNCVKVLRTTSPLTPESLASFSQRLTTNRANPYFKPLGYSRLASGLQSFPNTPCDAGINASLVPTTPNDSNFNVRTGGRVDDATTYFDLVRAFAFTNQLNTADVPRPPCNKQGPFRSVGRSPEFSAYLHVRRDR
jgi:virulence factor Mce-like protein